MLGATVNMVVAMGWTEIGGVFTVISVALVFSSVIMAAGKKWRTQITEEDTLDKRIITALFGLDAIPPYPAIDGLIKEHQMLHGRVEELEANTKIMSDRVQTLIERTQENGGSSIKDQLNVITAYIVAQNKLDDSKKELAKRTER